MPTKKTTKKAAKKTYRVPKIEELASKQSLRDLQEVVENLRHDLRLQGNDIAEIERRLEKLDEEVFSQEPTDEP